MDCSTSTTPHHPDRLTIHRKDPAQQPNRNNDTLQGASTVWEILKEAGIDPAPERNSSTWAIFLRSQADALLACDFMETVTLSGVRMY
ncbi:hypothetical protein AB4212_00595, partial [Streptomyces sp. 2MCAF27]